MATTMSEETVQEVIKSCAYGYSVDELVEHYGMGKADAENFVKDHVADIEEAKAYLKEGGFLE